MADDEQFSLCWNNFNTNLSAGFHESLCRGDLVDVSLAAEGHIVKAHRLVLSVCSPFFRKMFTQMPSNTHAIVFLNNVSHSALKDLIQFMYCGEVNVKQDALPAFISTAESLQIKGLTDNDPAPQPPQEPTPPPQASPHVQQQQQQVPAQRIQRQQARAPARYKIETVEDGLDDDNKGGTTTQIVIQTSAAPAQATIVQQQQTQPQTQQIQTGTTTTATLGATNKRSAQRSSLTSTSGVVKRSKTSLSASSNIIDPLEATTETATTTSAQLVPQITVQTTVVSAGDSKLRQQHQQQQEEAEYIGLPIDLPTKSEPDYVEDAGDAAGDGETTYVEDDAYGDMRYDESYFTENEDGAAQGSGAETSANVSGNVTATTSKAVVKQSQSYSDSSYVDAGADQSNTEAQVATLPPPPRKRGRPKTKLPENAAAPKPKLIDKLRAATLNKAASEPAVYASTTKGGVKLYFDGHLFRFSFRKADFSVFQCCYREHGEECKVRVVCDQKRVFPYDGEHAHFMQASDKSCLPSQFMPGESGAIAAMEKNKGQKVEFVAHQDTKAKEEPNNDSNDDAEDGEETEFELHEIEDVDVDVEQTSEKSFLQDIGKTTPEEDNNTTSLTADAPVVDEVNPNDFREKIKRRLQRALQNKKK